MNNINLSGRVLTALIDFNLLVDTDIGLIRFIRNNFQDDRVFKLDIVNKSDRAILSLLYSRENWNPLSIISTKDNMKDIDKLYKSFFDTYKQDILKLSLTQRPINKFVELMFANRTSFAINPMIYVVDDLEAFEIRRFFSIDAVTDTKDKNALRSKDVYYVKDYRFFTTNHIENTIVQKKIYMSPRRYNSIYIQNHSNRFTEYNDIISIGKDFSQKEETNKDGK
jgi:hypothetical protein